ncbi:hypothetical protein FORMB_16930 [Formosa sp. Hel1_33_131]|uniref:hypothetical protein n=1 Tax=Formosa sp. Hel1_33_131 TaxID=1336794 RepID=UPI00084E1400|nr:hypothetical protein [Formosa sp. Hel1_33_131]AOR28732.1 hypothetical protein FORMB_16930 [Formosa sp. Hel1_33_131]
MLKKKLKKALKKAGLNEGLAELINITSEDQIDDIVNQLQTSQSSDDDVLDFEEILKSEAFEEFVQESGFDKVLDFSKTLQSEHDRKVTKGIATGLDNFLKKKGGKSKKEGGKESNSAEDDNTPDYAKAILERLEKIENGNKKSEFSEKVTEALKDSKLPDSLKTKWASRVIEGDVSIEKQVKALEEEQQELYKTFVGENAGSGLPSGGPSDKKVSDEEVGELVEGLGI